MPKKATGNDAVAFGPRVANDLVDLLDVHKGKKQLGAGTPHKASRTSQTSVRVRNNSGGNLARGSVLRVDGDLLTGLSTYDSEHLTFGGATPNANQKYGILRHATPSADLGELQVDGVCIARVLVNDASDTHASPVSGQTYLTSGTSGPLVILDKESGTGEVEAVVCWRPKTKTPPFYAIVTEGIDGYRRGSGSVEKFDSGLVQPFALEINSAGVLDESAALDTSFGTVSAYNVARYKLVSGDTCFVQQDWQGRYWAVPVNHQFPVQVELTGNLVAHTTPTHTHTAWSIATAGTRDNWGDLVEADTSGGNNDVKFRYTHNYDFDFLYHIDITSVGNAITASPNLFYLTISAGGIINFKSPPLIQQGTTNANSQNALSHDGYIRGQWTGYIEGSLLGSMTATLVGHTTGTTWSYSYALRLRPQAAGLALAVGY